MSIVFRNMGPSPKASLALDCALHKKTSKVGCMHVVQLAKHCRARATAHSGQPAACLHPEQHTDDGMQFSCQ